MQGTLKQLLHNPEVREEVENPHHADGTLLNDFCDGSVFKTHPMFSINPKALQIIGYYDELEVVNPIGSYVRKHKLGCLFFILGNIRPRYRSCLKCIFLVGVAKCIDIEQYGIDAFLAPFVDDLKELYLDGVCVQIDGVEHTFHGALLAMLADTMAAQTLGGFKESCSFALRVCRTCMISKSQIQECFTEAECIVRTPEEHEKQCLLLNGPLAEHFSTTYGINRRSILEDVPGFSVTTGLPHDIMHDLFEGVVPYELKYLLHHCVESKYFTITELNNRIVHFDFPEDTPSEIDPAVGRHPDTSKIRQSACQMIALAYGLPLLVGDKVPLSDEKWESFLLLLKICSIALSPVCTYDTVAYLHVLVEEKLATFQTVYPSVKLLPKHHFMLHYPGQIEMYGPLLHTWTMRHEAKLSFLKRSSRRGNFKNICLTVSKAHQMWLCYQFESEGHLLYPQPEVSSKVTQLDYRTEPEGLQLQLTRQLVDVPCSSEHTVLVRHPVWLKIQSSTYKAGVYVLLERDYISPTFGKILDIAILEELNAVFVVRKHLL